ncbi:MAG TPA: YaaR family protein [Peptococcaceae bacterium]|nr:YaaR family protein [Peptococcaceae bacterium]
MSLRVNDSGQSNSLSLSQKPNLGKKGPDFNSILTQTKEIQSQELELFLKRLENQGQKLAQTMSIEDLLVFKSMVKRFLKSTFGQSRTLQEESVWDYRGQPKILARVTKINRALEELGEQILATQKEPLKILAKIDEIKGLIIDLFA